MIDGMNLGNSMRNVSEGTWKIADRFKAEADRVFGKSYEDITPPRDMSEVAFVDYRKAIDELVPDAAGVLTAKVRESDELPQVLLQKVVKLQRVSSVEELTSTDLHLAEGNFCFPVMVPFDSVGNPWSEEEIARVEVVRWVVIDANEKTVSGFSGDPSYVGNFFPAECKALGFKIGKYEKTATGEVSVADLNRLIVQHMEAYQKLQAMMAAGPNVQAAGDVRTDLN